jgi:adenine-specific DNA-methyltransferase
MRGMADSSVSLIATDPPYFKVKKAAWDNQWAKPEQFLAWVGELCAEWQRILKPSGSLYVFASPQMAHGVESITRQRFAVLNNIRWRKEAGWHKKAQKETLRGFLSPYESIIFAEHYNADNVAKGEAGYAAKCDELRGFVFEPLRAYLDGERKRAGVDKADCNAACGFSRTPGGMASRHYFSRSQWCLPTREHYEALQRLFNADRTRPEDLRRDYEYLRRDYEDLRRDYEDLRRPFNATPFAPYTDVWDFPTVQAYPGKHECEKPLALMEHIVALSSRPGDVVLDCFAGSGVTGEAAANLGRSFVGIEKDARWCERAANRINGARRALTAAA